ncbi:related to NAD-dependent deacetylase Sirtuin 5 [Serendipita indica DSM 11827]|uniref:Related to NAD-dependent deacetylase Sirtuin 5 n=1 Tax=Serendipita indica (strain DSM 11827) TaxID=1109443 RepID=G4TTJ8_SERID|nr:related to NAD-dependent deacetylase Sirtuin 5 [Serendipita indica DSM 11827]
MPPSASESEFQDAVRKAKCIIVVAGAGLSAASGRVTFQRVGACSMTASSQVFQRFVELVASGANPSFCWQFYHYRRETALKCAPNDAHRVLAQLSIPKTLKKIAPNATSYDLITQNVDGLSPRALRELEAEIMEARGEDRPAKSERPRLDSITEMHGKLFEVKCSSDDCNWAVEDYTMPLCPALGATSNELEDIQGGIENTEKSIDEKDLPRCAKCGALARPGVVWFGETPRYMSEINQKVFRADLCLVIGTSSTVMPIRTFDS